MKKTFTILLVVMILFAGCTKNKETEANSTLHNTATPSKTIVPTNIVPSSIPTTDPSNDSKNQGELIIGNTSANLAYVGDIASDGEWHYYNPITSDQPGKLAKMKKDGGEVIVICEDEPYFINIAGEWIYYIKQKEGVNYCAGEIYKIKKDGTQKTELYSNECYQLTLIGDWLYFIDWSDNSKLYRIKLDGSSIEIVNDMECSKFLYDNKCLYVITYDNDQYNLYKYSLEDLSSPTQTTNNIMIGSNVSLGIFNDFIYYTNDQDDCLYQVDSSGKNVKVITDQAIQDSFIVSEDGSIYLPIYDGLLALYRYDIYTENMEKITQNNHIYNIIGEADDYIYFLDDINEEISKLVRLRKDGSNNTGNKDLDIDFEW